MKNKRQEKLLELIKDNAYYTQDELQEALNNLGYNVTQSTVSRDIKQLRIIKTLDSDGNYRYISNFHSSSSDNKTNSHYEDIFRRSAIKVDCAFNDVVIKCHPGMASSACVTIDNFFGNMIMGSLAGDDTIFVITKTPEIALQLTEKLRNMCKE
ncbi:MAG: arginine repressor [Acutalibacteraceae bacterium]|nr:arginine repressor [Acutalibacteraceae bacterium]